MEKLSCYRSHCFLGLGMALLAVACGGCGASDLGTVTGRVVHPDGTPLALARVIANCEEKGKTAFGSTDMEGYYELSLDPEKKGIPPGTYSVYLIEDRGVVEGQMKRTIAKKYTAPNTSGLTFEVAAGEKKVFDITAESP